MPKKFFWNKSAIKICPFFWHSWALSVIMNNTLFWTHTHSYFYFILSTIHLFIKTFFKYLFIIYTFVHTSYRHLHLENVLHTTGTANYIFIVYEHDEHLFVSVVKTFLKIIFNLSFFLFDFIFCFIIFTQSYNYTYIIICI